MLKKLFKVLVLGGSALVGTTQCGPSNANNNPPPQNTDGGTPPTSDGGNPHLDGGGGPKGW